MTLTSGALLKDRYKVISILGQGGMGAVYFSEDNHLGVNVAIKENLFLSDGYSRQFQREANILASLRHSALPKVIDYFIIPNQGQYLIMEFIDGEDLRQRIERLTCVSEKDVVIIGIVICEAIQYLHSRPQTIIHRDIKPGNIKITPEGEIVLVDFGLAKVIENKDNPERQDTITGARAMTPGYSPPEQYGTARTDQRSDIYALGATLYAALTGIIPEDGLSRMTGKMELTPLRQLNSKISSKLASVIERALEVDPDFRFQDADEFRRALIAASELTFNTLEKLRVSPPPAEGSEVSLSSTNTASLNTNKNRSARTRNHLWLRKFTKSTPGWLPVTLLLFLTLAVIWSLLPPFMKPYPYNNQGIPSSPPITGVAATQPSQPAKTIDPTIVNSATLPAETLTPASAAAVNEHPIPTPLPANTNSPADSKIRIAFVSDRTGTMQIWSMNTDGSDQKQLTNIPAGACQPAFSPDGQKLAVISPCTEKRLIYENSQIFILGTDGNDDVKPLPLPEHDGSDFDPAWSHDSTRLAFTSTRNGAPHIFLYNFKTSALEELSDTRFPDLNPTWNIGDKQLAFSRQGTAAYHIWLMSDKGLTQSQFSSSGEINDILTDWSHNGEFVIFTRTPVDSSIPYLVRLNYKDRNTGAETRLTPAKNNSTPIYGGRLSPDDNWIAFESWPDGHNHDIYLMDIKGNNFIRLTNDPGNDFYPIWIPETSD
jgi:eukaryotic-like serine/threonine-protein kinase